MSWIPSAVKDNRVANATGRFLYKHRTKFIVASAVAIGVGIYYQLTAPSSASSTYADRDADGYEEDEDGNMIKVGAGVKRSNGSSSNRSNAPLIKPGMRSR